MIFYERCEADIFTYFLLSSSAWSYVVGVCTFSNPISDGWLSGVSTGYKEIGKVPGTHLNGIGVFPYKIGYWTTQMVGEAVCRQSTNG